MIVGYLTKFGKTKRSAIDNLIIPKLSAVLNETQKRYKVGNMLSALRNEKKIKNIAYGTWEIV
jgi:ATP-dependent DNA helicase RecG